MTYKVTCVCGWTADLWSISGTQTAASRHRRACNRADEVTAV